MYIWLIAFHFISVLRKNDDAIVKFYLKSIILQYSLINPSIYYTFTLFATFGSFHANKHAYLLRHWPIWSVTTSAEDVEAEPLKSITTVLNILHDCEIYYFENIFLFYNILRYCDGTEFCPIDFAKTFVLAWLSRNSSVSSPDQNC